MRPRNPLDSRNDYEPESGTPTIVGFRILFNNAAFGSDHKVVDVHCKHLTLKQGCSLCAHFVVGFRMTRRGHALFMRGISAITLQL